MLPLHHTHILKSTMSELNRPLWFCRPPALRGLMVQYRWRDLNPHAFATVSKTVVPTNYTTSAYKVGGEGLEPSMFLMSGFTAQCNRRSATTPRQRSKSHRLITRVHRGHNRTITGQYRYHLFWCSWFSLLYAWFNMSARGQDRTWTYSA